MGQVPLQTTDFGDLPYEAQCPPSSQDNALAGAVLYKVLSGAAGTGATVVERVTGIAAYSKLHQAGAIVDKLGMWMYGTNPGAAEGVDKALKATWDALPQLKDGLVDAAPKIFDGVKKAGPEIKEGLTRLPGAIIDGFTKKK